MKFRDINIAILFTLVYGRGYISKESGRGSLSGGLKAEVALKCVRFNTLAI